MSSYALRANIAGLNGSRRRRRIGAREGVASRRHTRSSRPWRGRAGLRDACVRHGGGATRAECRGATRYTWSRNSSSAGDHRRTSECRSCGARDRRDARRRDRGNEAGAVPARASRYSAAAARYCPDARWPSYCTRSLALARATPIVVRGAGSGQLEAARRMSFSPPRPRAHTWGRPQFTVQSDGSRVLARRAFRHRRLRATARLGG